MSQEDLASKSGLDRTYISGVERSVRNITLESLESIIVALDIDPFDFLLEVINDTETPNSLGE
jgi:transcriptional regulator with XRE-family HTH domain